MMRGKAATAYLRRFFAEHRVNEYELFPKDAPWPIRRELSPRRKTLLSWIDFGPGGRILELTSGCGALTAHLATLPHAITAVAATPEEAAIIRDRCREARDLEILTATPPDRSGYDVVIVAGPVEDAAAEEDGGPCPLETRLRVAVRALADDGCLILAAPNRMGHKYLAGLPEEHTGRPYHGVNGFPGDSPARTCDRPSLRALLTRVGLPAGRWFFPSPDVVLPDSIVSERALALGGFPVLPLLELPSPDHDGDAAPAFGERAFLRSVLAGGVAGHFMNAFLVLAAKKETAPLLLANEGTLAVAVNADSCPPRFQTMTRFEATDAGVIVSRKNLHGLPPAVFAAGRQHLKAREACHLGYASFLETVLDAVEDGDTERAAGTLTAWMEQVAARARPATAQGPDGFAAFCRERLGRAIYSGREREPWLPGSLLDAHPGNVLLHPATGDIRYIDLEWQLACDIPLQLVIDRGVNLVAQKLARQATALDLPVPGALPPGLAARLAGHPLHRNPDLPGLAAITQWLFAAVTHGDLDHRQGTARP